MKRLPVALKSRIKFFYGKVLLISDDDVKQKEHCISPQTYLPKTKLTENLRFSQVIFGIGGRSPNENTSKLHNNFRCKRVPGSRNL
jgi:hypothetical protein